MGTSKNRVQLTGYAGRDPEIINLESGRKLAKFSMATTDLFKNSQGQWLTDTQWHHIVAWGKTADLVETTVKKGKEVVILGKLSYRDYQAQDGSKRLFTEIVCKKLSLVEKEKVAEIV